MAGNDTSRALADNTDASLSATLMDECPFPIFRTLEDGSVLSPNKAACEAEGLLSKNHKKLLAKPQKLAEKAFSTGETVIADFKSGDKIFNLYFDPMPPEGYVNVYGRDVTRIREQMREMVDYAKFPEENPNPVMRISTDAEVLVANPSAREMPGLIELGARERLCAELAAVVMRLKRSKGVDAADFDLPDGRVFHFSFAYIKGKDYVNMYGRETTAERTAKRELEAANDRLEARVAERTASVRLLQNIVLQVNSAESFEAALQAAIHEVCTFANWSVGHAYSVRHEHGKQILVPSGIWHVDKNRGMSALRKASETLRFSGDDGIPGRVCADGQAVWIEDIEKDKTLQRSEFAKAAGLRSVMAFPIVLHDQVVGVLEFFSREAMPADFETIKTLGNVGSLLGAVAQRSQAEEAVARSREEAETAHGRLMDALEAMGQAICLFDKDDNTVLFNQRYVDLYKGFTGGVAPSVGNAFEVGLRLSAPQMHPEMSKKEHEAWIQNILRTRREVGVRNSTDKMPDGRWYRSEGFDTTDGGTVSVFTDITEAKQHETELARLADQAELAHGRLMDAIEAMGQAVSLFDKDDRLVMWNSQYESVAGSFAPKIKFKVGLPFKEILTSSAERLHPEHTKAQRKAWIESVLEEWRTEDSRMSTLHLPDGRWLRSEGYRTSDHGTISVFTDMTEIKQSEDKMAQLAQESEIAHSRLKDAIEAMGQGFVLYDKEDRVVLHNQRVIDMFKSSLGEANFHVGKTFEEIARKSRNATRNFKSQKDVDEWVDQVLKYRRENKTRHSIDQQPDGRWLRSEGFETQEGGIVSVFTDITEAKQHEAELDELVQELGVARDEAIEANSAKSQFLANMSHELRTPLNAIIGYSELLIDETADDGNEDYVPDLTKIQRAGQHLLGLINDILDLSKIEVGKLELYVEEFQISDLLTDISNTITPLVEKNKNRLEIVDKANVVAVKNDLTKIRQSLFNLLSNAAKFSENGLITLEITSGSDGQINFAVHDQGIGLTEEQMGRIFDPFTQADSSTSKNFGGTGLGLSISREFCRMMGGELVVASRLGEGSTFTMSVLTDGSGLGHTQEHEQKEVHIDGDAPVVLVIDDDANVRELLKRNFATAGLRTIDAKNGEEGLRIAREQKPNVITLDVMMPKSDGWTVLEALKADPETAKIPVVMVSIVENKQLGFSLGASEYLTKPVEREKLIGIVQTLIGSETDPVVLIVEDDKETRSLLCRTLVGHGIKVEEAENGRAALEKLNSIKPSLLLLDLMMPEMDGFEFAEEFRKNETWNQVPIIVLSAKTLTEDDRARLEGWAEAYYPKGNNSLDHVVAEVKNQLAAQE